MKHTAKCCRIVIVALVTAVFLTVIPFTAVQAATIDFDKLQPFNNYDPIPDGYGSTADVAVSYQTLDIYKVPVLSYAEMWNSGYADLKTAAYAGYNGGILAITLTAKNSSQLVKLNSFAVAAYPTANFTRLADIFEVVDGNGNVLANYGDFYISGLVAQTLYPDPDVKASSLTILLGYDWNNGVNYINFSTSAVPVPAAVWLLGSGLLGLVGIRRKISK